VPTLSLSAATAAEAVVDALVIGSIATPDGADVAAGHGLPRKAVVHLQAVLSDLEATGQPDELVRVVSVPGVRATSVVLTGLGTGTTRQTRFAADDLRAAASVALRSLAGKRKVAVALPAPDAQTVGVVADGAYAGCYRYAKPGAKETGGTTGSGPAITVLTSEATKAHRDAVARAAVLGSARDLARDLVNTPPNLLYPQTFVERVRQEISAAKARVSLSVLDEKALAKGGFGGIVGVGQGSARPPRLATLRYTPAKKRGSVALVGKGITFDSGGLCIKPPASMLTMKSDMAGAAAVAAAVLAAARLGLPVEVTGYLCLAENMPSGTAQRPGDVVTMRDGTTVEILDTDAEGRMVLGDGLCLAAESTPDIIVDIATLTGAQMVALGSSIAGVMGNDDSFREQVVRLANESGEPSWAMPLPEELRKGLDSPVADLAHKADRWGGMLTAGLFLQTFVPEGTPWAHIDIAGPSFHEKAAAGFSPKGGTGFGVATLLALVENHGS
jgi:leucyl aminopeptidase